MALTQQQFQRLKQLHQVRLEGGKKVRPQNVLTKDDNEQGFFGDMAQDVGETFDALGEVGYSTFTDSVDALTGSLTGERNPVKAGFDIAGNIGEGILGTVGAVGTGIGKAALPQGVEDTLSGVSENVGGFIADQQVVQDAVDFYNSLDSETQQDLETTGDIAELLLGVVTLGTSKVITQPVKDLVLQSLESTGRGISKATSPVRNTAQRIGSATQGVRDTSMGIGRGLYQGGKRVGSNMKKKGQERKELEAERATLSPTEQKAVDVGIPDKVRALVNGQDSRGLQTLREEQSAADRLETETGYTGDSPHGIAGQLFIDKFKLLEQERKRVGQKIGDITSRLSQTTTVDISSSLDKLYKTLQENGIKVNPEADTVKEALTFTPQSKFTKRQRTFIRGIYEEASSGGTELTPSEIYSRSQIFSKMQREAKLEQVQDLTYTKSDGSQGNLFEDAQDIFRSELSTLSPQLRTLQAKYAPLVRIKQQVVDDILSVKEKKFSDNVPLDEFRETAAIKLGRILGRSESTGRIKRLNEAVEIMAKSLGDGSMNVVDALRFAQALEKLYDIVPERSFVGGLEQAKSANVPTDKYSVIDNTIGKVVELGQSSAEDKREALQKLIDELLKKSSTPSEQ